jgi:hypothetical protein
LLRSHANIFGWAGHVRIAFNTHTADIIVIDYTVLHSCVHTSIVMEALWFYFQKIIHIHFPYIQHAVSVHMCAVVFVIPVCSNVRHVCNVPNYPTYHLPNSRYSLNVN